MIAKQHLVRTIEILSCLKLHDIAFACLLLVLLTLVPGQVARAEPESACSGMPSSSWEPENSEREFRSERYRFSFRIPRNYRVAAHSQDTFFVFPGEEFAMYQCQMENNLFQEYQWQSFLDLGDIVIKISQIGASNRNLSIRDLSLHQSGVNNFHDTEILNINGFQGFRYSTWRTSTTWTIHSILRPDKRYLVSISYIHAGDDTPRPYFPPIVVEQMLESFHFF
jgi:hypothetical protein